MNYSKFMKEISTKDHMMRYSLTFNKEQNPCSMILSQVNIIKMTQFKRNQSTDGLFSRMYGVS